MSENLILGLPMPVTLALFGMTLILLALASLAVALRKMAPVRMPSYYDEAPYKVEAPDSLPAGRLDVVAHAGRDCANR